MNSNIVNYSLTKEQIEKSDNLLSENEILIVYPVQKIGYKIIHKTLDLTELRKLNADQQTDLRNTIIKCAIQNEEELIKRIQEIKIVCMLQPKGGWYIMIYFENYKEMIMKNFEEKKIAIQIVESIHQCKEPETIYII